jgi:hypothetical protein
MEKPSYDTLLRRVVWLSVHAMALTQLTYGMNAAEPWEQEVNDLEHQVELANREIPTALWAKTVETTDPHDEGDD